MLPTLLQLGPVRIASFSVFMLLAFLSSTFIVWRASRREYLSEEKTMDIYLLAIIWGIIGARISYILLYPDKFGLNILRMLLPTWMPGFYVYGGVVMAIFAIVLLGRKHEVHQKKYLDIIVPGAMLAAGFYKVGQFLDGSLIGISTSVRYLGLPVTGEAGLFVPLALIQAVIYFIAFYLVNKWSKYFLITRKLPTGLFLSALTIASGIESLSFFITRDKLFIAQIPVSFVISILAFIVSGSLLYKLTRNFKEDIKPTLTFIKKTFIKKIKCQ